MLAAAQVPQVEESAIMSTTDYSWSSSPFNLGTVTDNNLGLVSKHCADSFCRTGVNGLDLWICLEEVRGKF